MSHPTESNQVTKMGRGPDPDSLLYACNACGLTRAEYQRVWDRVRQGTPRAVAIGEVVMQRGSS